MPGSTYLGDDFGEQKINFALVCANELGELGVLATRLEILKS